MNHDAPGATADLAHSRTSSVNRLRLDERLAGAWDHRLTLVTAPAGSGKTTLVNQFAATAAVPTVRYRADGDDASVPALLARLSRACVEALGPSATPWGSVAEMADALHARAERRVLFVVDDLHTLEGTEAERALAQLLGRLPAGHAMLVASRRPPRFNLSRMRVSGELLEIGPDDLRFRTWEVERLFRDLYQEPLGPEDLADLARRTEGWAAGLRLFHLATRGKTPSERRRVLKSLGVRSRLVREYLAQNVLDELPQDTRRFLVGTCTLGRLNAELCDALLGTTGSREVLEELERTQLFTYSLGEEGWYRYHEVLRAHLETELSERHGRDFVRASYQRAAGLLEAAGAPGDALRAYCCAEDWGAAARVIGRDGAHLVDDTGAWFEALPPALVDHDPWLLLAGARRLVAAARLPAAADTYRRAETAFGPSAAGDVCRRERHALLPWTDGPAPGPGDAHWLSLVRVATQRDPEAAMRRAAALPGPTGRFAQGVAAGLAGRVQEAQALLGAAAEDPSAGDLLAVAALTAAAAFAVLAGGDPDLDRVAAETERLDVSALTRMGRALVAVGKGAAGDAEAAAVEATCRRGGDEWGAAVISLLRGTVASRRGEEAGELNVAAEGFRRLGAGTLAAMATGPAPPGVPAPPPAPAQPRRNGVAAEQAVVRCFGRFTIAVGGADIDLTAVKPRARTALRMLAVSRRRPVHREVLVGALWPGADVRTGTRNLHVVVSSLRHLLEPDAVRGGATLVAREGEAYCLALPAGADCDLDTFDARLAEGRTARDAGDLDAAVRAFDGALAAYAGELLPEDGPADWVVDERDRLRLAAASAAMALGEVHQRLGDWAAAAEACERGIQLDRYGDGLWRLLIDVRRGGGDHAAAQLAAEGYRTVLADLGLPVTGDAYVALP